MNALPWHPLVVHLPMALAVLMPLLAGSVLFCWWRGWFRPRAWAVVVAGQVLLFAGGFLAMRTGEQDEDRVEALVPEAALEHHEEAAETFLLGAGLVAALAVLPLLLGRRRLSQAAGAVTVAGTLAVLWLGVQVGEAGGELVYRHGAAAAHAWQGQLPPARREHDDDHR